MTERAKRAVHFLKRPVHLWGLVAAFGVIVSLSTVLGFLGRFGWFLDLFSHFRVQYFVSLSIVTLLLLILKRRMVALGFGLFALINLCTVLPLYVGGSTAPVDTPQSHRVMLANVNTEHGDVTRVTEAIQQYDPDILVLEEVNTEWLSELQGVLGGYPHSKAEPREDNFGIAIYSKLPFARSDVQYIGNAGVPSIVAVVETPDGPCTVIATHPLPPGGAENSRLRNYQLARLPEVVRQATSPVLLLGDLNVSPWCHHFRRLLKESGLRDSSKGRGVQPTWPTDNPLLLIPIDHCLHSRDIHIVRKEIGPKVRSDHYPVIIDFMLLSGEEKKGISGDTTAKTP